MQISTEIATGKIVTLEQALDVYAEDYAIKKLSFLHKEILSSEMRSFRHATSYSSGLFDSKCIRVVIETEIITQLKQCLSGQQIIAFKPDIIYNQPNDFTVFLKTSPDNDTYEEKHISLCSLQGERSFAPETNPSEVSITIYKDLIYSILEDMQNSTNKEVLGNTAT